MFTEEKSGQRGTWDERIKKEVIQFVSCELRRILNSIDTKKLRGLEEIRLRANKPLILKDSRGDWFVDLEGDLKKSPGKLYNITQTEVLKTFELMSGNSVYAFQEEIKNGFITLKGGHRVGIAGKIVLEGTHIKNIKDISSLNIRIAREVLGCSKKILPYIIKNANEIYNTLIISPPQCGKTTILRDLARKISDGAQEYHFDGVKVGVVDERSEIAACFKGVPQNRIGIRTDVLDGCPKAAGMAMMLRSMSPHVIITDEIGNAGDNEAIMQLVNAGVKIVTTAHGYNISELETRREVIRLIQQKVFERYIVLSSFNGPGTVDEVVDGKDMKVIYRRADAYVS